MSENGERRFEILGQKFPYPETAYALAGLFVVVLGIFAVLYLVLVVANTERLTLVTRAIYQWNGRRIESPEQSRVVQFWSPSSDTCQYAQKDSVGKVVADDNWLCVSDQKVKDFDEKVIQYPEVIGYRRHNVFGHGRTEFKEGLWWTLNVTKKFSIESFVYSYSQFWGNKRDVYVEEIGSRNVFVGSKQQD